jgi:hypothetical protein
LRAFAELFALSGVAIAQPLLDLLSKNTGVFVATHANGLQTVALVVLILVLVPAVLWILEVVVGALVPRARPGVHAAFAGLLIGVLALEVVKKQTDLGSAALIRIAIVVGLAGAALVFLFTVVRQFLHILAIAPLVFALMFLGFSPATDVVFNGANAHAVSVGIKHPHRVVMIVLDEFPEMSLLNGNGHVDSELFPNLAGFAADATWYRNETTVAPFTDLAVPAILTGKYPKDPADLPDAQDYPQSLFTLLGKSLVMNVHESVTRMCPSNLCKTGGSGRGFGSLVKRSTDLWREYASPERFKFSFSDDLGVGIAVPTMNDFVASLQPSSGPELDYVHIVLPHNPWHYLPTLQDTKNTDMRGAETLAWGNKPLADQGRVRHLLQAQAADTLVGRAIAKLKKIGAYDDSLIVVTADHGVSFTAGAPMRTVTERNYPQIMWPPLFVKYPGQSQGKLDDRPAQSVDIVPTVADVLGVSIPYAVDGRSLLGPARAEGPRPFYEWQTPGLNGMAGGLIARPGQHLSFDGAAGFRAVLASRAAPAGRDPGLRVYATGKYGSLVGRSVDGLVRGRPEPYSLSIGTIASLRDVHPNAVEVPWAFHEGGIPRAAGAVDVAFVISGRVVAVTEALPLAKGGSGAFFTFSIPPVLVHTGRNDLSAYSLAGNPRNPTLAPIALGP